MAFNTISNRELRKSSPESKNHSRRIQARFLFKFKRHWTCFPLHSRMFILIFLLPRFHFSRFINLRPNALRLFLLTHPANLNTCSAHKSIAQREFNNRCFFYSSGLVLFRTIWSAQFFVGLAPWCEKVNILSAFRTELPFSVLWSAQVTSAVDLRLWLFSKIVEVQRVLEPLKCPSMCTGSRSEDENRFEKRSSR